ncbi:MAG: DUF368 domain-containing protein, partial [Desulfobacterales bacterium]
MQATDKPHSVWKRLYYSLREKLAQRLDRLGWGTPVAKDAAWSLILKIIYTGISFLIAVALARLLGAEGYGIYAYAYAVVILLALPAHAGLPNLVVRETARGMAANQPSRVQGIWRWSARLAGLISLTLALLTSLVLIIWKGGRMGAGEWTMAWALALIPLVALGNLRGAALRGLHRIVSGQLPGFVIRPALFLLLLGGLALVDNRQFNPPQAMALHVLAAAIAFGAGVWLLWRNMPQPVRQAQPRFEGRAWFASTLPLAFIASMQLVNNHADILVLGFFKPSDQVGIYRVAVQVAALSSFGLQAVNAVVAPRFAKLYTQGNMERLQRLVTGSARVVFVFNLLTVVFFFALGRPLLGLVFGGVFVNSYVPLVILMAGQMVNSAAGSVAFLLGFVLAFLVSGETSIVGVHSPVMIFLSGALSIIALILPGISGAFIL